jgi:hypothetical protein
MSDHDGIPMAMATPQDKDARIKELEGLLSRSLEYLDTRHPTSEHLLANQIQAALKERKLPLPKVEVKP